MENNESEIENLKNQWEEVKSSYKLNKSLLLQTGMQLDIERKYKILSRLKNLGVKDINMDGNF